MRRGETQAINKTQSELQAGKGARVAFATGGALALVAAGVMLRIYFRDIPNFSPVAAIALYAGFAYRRAWRAIWIPLSVMAASDLVIGGYDLRLLLTVYAMLALPTLAGVAIRRHTRAKWAQWAWAIALSCIGSVAFFVVTNSAVWAFSTWYAHDTTGWLQCLSAGIPFFRYTLTGDLAFGALLFGSHALVVAIVERRRASALLPAAE